MDARATDAATLDQLARDLAALAFVPGTDTAAHDARRLLRCRRLLDVKVRFEAKRGPDASPVVVVAGGTNVGKSTVFNWLACESVSRSSALARFTKWPAVYVHQDERGALAEGAFLPGYQKLSLESGDQLSQEGEGLRVYVKSHARDEARSTVLVDSPDIDSTHERNRQVAQDLLDLADAVVFVATPEKYNDDVCVEYLKEAFRAGKRIVCVLNKCADEEVKADLASVLAKTAAEVAPPAGFFAAGPVAPVLLAVPYLPSPGVTAEGSWRETLRLEAAAPGAAAKKVRASALAGTRVRLARELEFVTGRLRDELSVLDRLRSEADAALVDATEGYRAFLVSLDFYELDRVFEKVLEHFRIPVVDDVYEGMRKVAGSVSNAISRTLTGSVEEDARELRLRERRDRDRNMVKELFEAARSRVAKLPDQVGPPFARVAPGWSPPPPTLEAVNASIEQFVARADEETERWVEAEARRHVDFFQAHPYLKNGLRLMKGTLQIGFGLVSAYLTGGLLHSPIEGAVSGLLIERGMKLAVDKMGGFVHYQTLKSDFTRARAELFHALLAKSVRRPLLDRLPVGAPPEALARIDAVARDLARGEA